MSFNQTVYKIPAPILHTHPNGLTDDVKIRLITNHLKEILEILGMDMSDDSLKGTPHRVAKMYVKETFSGLNPANKPEIRLFENKYQYNEILIEKNITLFSCCEHHLVPIIGKVHIGYIPNDKVIGLSKINRLVQYYAKRPQVQERLTMQIANGLKEALHSDDVAVVVYADHLCVSSRGIHDTNSSTVTTSFSGKFLQESNKADFFTLLNAVKL